MQESKFTHLIFIRVAPCLANRIEFSIDSVRIGVELRNKEPKKVKTNSRNDFLKAIESHLKMFDASFLEQIIDGNELRRISMMFQPLIVFVTIHIPSTNHFASFSLSAK